MIYKFEEDTLREVAERLFPTKQHTKLAKSVVEYIAEECKKTQLDDTSPRLDLGTLQGFVEFLIKEKGYN